MSTRRARIKAVTSLPPRRKNNADNAAKTKPAQLIDDTQKAVKSPRTPRSLAAKEGGEKVLRPTPPLLPLHSTPILQSKVSSPAKPNSETPKVITRTPKTAEKVSVITAAPSSIHRSIFASPPPRTDSPIRTASPIAALLRSTIRTPKPKTPQVEKPNLEVTVKVCEVNENEARILHEKDAAEAGNKSDVPDDYSVPSVPESITEEAVMDGIVPLQPARSVPKPIDLLKNEIISENAEVLFDPIVPLPSPSKVRPKLRPVPRLAPLRRNSIQGSASESEDESRRALLGGATTPAPGRQRHDSHTSHSTQTTMPTANREVNRIRTDSICSSASQLTQPALTASPTKEKHHKTRRQEMSRRMAAMRRRRETIQRDTLTMYDLIFYNPTSNPIVPDQDEIKAKEANKKDEAERAAAEADDDPDDPAPDAAPVPQIKLGPNGEIVLDEKSLVIKPTDSKRKVSSVVREGAWASGGGKYNRTARTAEWSAAETVRFYRALAAIGTDFSLMAPLFPGRNRRDLKIKFKKEEKVNGAQLDKALRSGTTWDPSRLQDEFAAERAEAAASAEREREHIARQRKAERERTALAKEVNLRQSRGVKALENSCRPSMLLRKRNSEALTADDIIERAKVAREEKKKQKKLAAAAKLQAKRGSTSKQQTPKTPFATITLLNSNETPEPPAEPAVDMATISRVVPNSSKTPSPGPVLLNSTAVPSNIESGSLVVLTVNDPKSPSKKMLQTYIAHGEGKLTPIALPPTFLNSVVGYMKKGTPKGPPGSPLTSPVTVINPDDKTATTSSVIQLNPSPVKRQRHSSYTITQL
ncbi:uncharacterized protein LOC114351972 isoform X3 [Ostrinia furnacalis]|uniref:uncharacterized protein LOC114351972 isoform X3 n=1 Tax=Ostrinia furnacalis TaxID=93504 RepID=UPI0010396E2B|nr:uncharacterized protein LOC114351972 isoform X3 [Ostrinia furnacalis]